MIRRNVLIFHQAALGDFIVTWPLAMALSRVFPQSRIIYVTHSEKGKLAERVLGLESADAELGWHMLHLPPPQVPKLPERAARLLEGAHTVVSFTAGKIDSLSQGVARVCEGVKVVSLDTKHGGGGHVTESLLGQLRDWPMLAAGMEQMLRSVAGRGVGFGLKPSGRIVIHPGAGGESKRWPAERFVELVERLRGAGQVVRVLLGEVETETWPRQSLEDIEKIAEASQPATLLDLLDEISAAKVFVGNDSGPGHLAGILGVPTVSLYGGAGPFRWRPLGPRVRLVESESLTTLSAERVYTTVTELAGG